MYLLKFASDFILIIVSNEDFGTIEPLYLKWQFTQ